MDILKDLILDEPKPENTCKGLIFKAEVTQYRTNRGFAFTTKINKMKSMSCKGCEKCGSLEDIIYEFISNDSPIIGFYKVENGKLYTFNICNMYRDWETGYVEDYDLEIVEYNPQANGDICQPEDK